MHDPLIGLPNRTAVYRRITTVLYTAHCWRTLLAVLLVDVDDFKVVDDSLGHAHGDAVLQRRGGGWRGRSARPIPSPASAATNSFVCEGIGTADTATALAARITAGLALIQMLG
ncbi:diguanylate cyclase domain-containing protein [Nocardia amamiensis]|uniref:diguanylate cyclase domain-containing protein n=1 Tax=Nocardia amamiensis TaxID=404578 RepID=UPI002B4B66A4|nr:diguanylate cyclase [Nocardia amamiensis]